MSQGARHANVLMPPTQDSRVRSVNLVEEQKIKNALAAKEWEKLKTHVFAECKKINQSSSVKLGFSAEGINEIVISNSDNGKRASLSYDPDVPCVFYETPMNSGHLAFRVSPDGTAVQFVRHGATTLIGTIAFDLIKDITA